MRIVAFLDPVGVRAVVPRALFVEGVVGRLRGLPLPRGEADPPVRIPEPPMVDALLERVAARRTGACLALVQLDPELALVLGEAVELAEVPGEGPRDLEVSLYLGPMSE